ncbi:p21-activated protein kinase-interacting protein 1-like [Elsinoe australis]|uniref:p21-activated protein kinase-interacting protein 1-like n=1 Tax=Elsinoe australis TaxID=40998 RepID=A0A2P8A103_9PEZI|nr:p21-activated protein kinase-interacting protein 1-like [Elsinoe australis]
MVTIKAYHLPPTPLIPNSPYPLLHYQSVLPLTSATPSSSSSPSTSSSKPEYYVPPTLAHDLLTSNKWQIQWIFRYGPTQDAHYHSQAHECMAVLSGHATIRFGVSDADRDAPGIELEANAGDVFVLPAGTAHKTFDTLPRAEFKLLTPGEGHGIQAQDRRGALEGVQLDGFTMLGAYPEGSKWDFAVGGEDVGQYERVWNVARPERDPVFGGEERGLCTRWKAQGHEAKL